MHQVTTADTYNLNEVLVASDTADPTKQRQISARPAQQRSLERFYSVDDNADIASGPALEVASEPVVSQTLADKSTAELITANLRSQAGSASPLLHGSGELHKPLLRQRT